MFKLENLIGVPSVISLKGVAEQFIKECDIKKLPHKTPRIKIITAVLRLTKAVKKPKKEKKEQIQVQLLPSVPSSQVNVASEVAKPIVNLKKRLQRTKAKIHASKNTSLHDYEDQDFDSEIEEVIEILRNALSNMSSDGETRELHSAVSAFVKSGFQTFKEHRKHIEKAMLHINAQKLLKRNLDVAERRRLNKNLAIVNLVKSQVNRLNAINAIENLNKHKVSEKKKKEEPTLSR